MAIQRVFLDWSRPALPAVVDYLLERYADSANADLSGAIVVLPGGRAGRRLLELLVEKCDQRQLALVPPQMTTVGGLPELLYQPQHPFADELVQQLTWTHALRSFDPKRLSHVIARPPDADDDERWMELGDLLKTLHRELASDMLDFSGVAEHAAELEGDGERRRWQVLAEIQRRYLDTLDGLKLWDRQTARRVAIERRECRLDRHVVLVGVVDANQTLREMLDLVADRVTALIVAPKSLAARFDAHGCLRPETWLTATIPLQDDQIFQADGVAEQAESVARRLVELDGAYRADEISIGVADERMVPHLLRELEECELPARWGPGKPISESAPYRLLSAAVRYLTHGRRYRDFAALARHADVIDWLARQRIPPTWLIELDDYYNAFLPARLVGKWRSGESKYAGLRKAHQCIEDLLEPLAGAARRLDQWSEPLSALLLAIYGERALDREDPGDRAVIESCHAIHESVTDLASVPPSLSPAVSAAEALRLALAQASTERMTPPADDAAIELLGWLELPLDDAPALVVSGFNEGFVPKSVTGDLFLPNTLRVRLGLEDNARRYARDAYALSVLAASRKVLRLIVGRADVEGNPLAPSRLLFAADAEIVARRALRFFAEPRDVRSGEPPLAGGLTTTRERPDFPVPKPLELESLVEKISASAVRTYLTCPYRYYLRHVLRLSAVDDEAAELDGLSFGNLMHEVLKEFAKGELRDSSDEEAIRLDVRALLDRHVSRMYGDHALTPVEIQVEQMRTRLDRFAEIQAERVAAGWLIEQAEVDVKYEMHIDDAPITLHGRIDRIDRHRETGKRIVIDYKSGDKVGAPDASHRKGGEWVDLQLPLYRHLVHGLGIDDAVDLAYFALPKDVAHAGVLLAEWSDEELAGADELFFHVVRKIRNQEFWPPAEEPPWRGDEFSVICQDGVFDRSL